MAQQIEESGLATEIFSIASPFSRFYPKTYAMQMIMKIEPKLLGPWHRLMLAEHHADFH
jgi:hypothetical protein